MKDKLMTLRTDFFDSALRNAAAIRAKELSVEGWATMSEEQLAKFLHDFAHEICGEVMRINEHLTNQLAEYLTTRPLVITK